MLDAPRVRKFWIDAEIVSSRVSHSLMGRVVRLGSALRTIQVNRAYARHGASGRKGIVDCAQHTTCQIDKFRCRRRHGPVFSISE